MGFLVYLNLIMVEESQVISKFVRWIVAVPGTIYWFTNNYYMVSVTLEK